MIPIYVTKNRIQDPIIVFSFIFMLMLFIIAMIGFRKDHFEDILELCYFLLTIILFIFFGKFAIGKKLALYPDGMDLPKYVNLPQNGDLPENGDSEAYVITNYSDIERICIFKNESSEKGKKHIGIIFKEESKYLYYNPDGFLHFYPALSHEFLREFQKIVGEEKCNSLIYVLPETMKPKQAIRFLKSETKEMKARLFKNYRDPKKKRDI